MIVKINKKISIRGGKKPLIVTEISGNHNGSKKSFLNHIKVAAKNGADMIKIQTYEPKDITIKRFDKKFKIKEGTWKNEVLWNLYKKAHTPFSWHKDAFNLAKKLIKGAKEAGADAVKFQKRTIELVYTKESLKSFRESPWGSTLEDQKKGLELGREEYDEINRFCNDNDIKWFASCWDVESLKFLKKYNCTYNKIASAMLTNYELINEVAKEKKHTFISTGMHTLKEIGKSKSEGLKYTTSLTLSLGTKSTTFSTKSP